MVIPRDQRCGPARTAFQWTHRHLFGRSHSWRETIENCGGAGSSETKPRPLFTGVHLQIPTMAITDAMALLKWLCRVDGSRRTSTETSCRIALSASKLGNKRPAVRVFERLSNNRGVERRDRLHPLLWRGADARSPCLEYRSRACGLLARTWRVVWRARTAPSNRRMAARLLLVRLAVAELGPYSPLCNLSVALFSARIAQHVVLTLLAAPLLVLGQAGRFSVPVFRKAARCCSNPKPSRGSQRLLVQRGRLCDCHVAVARALSVRCNFPKHAGLLDDAYQHDRRGHAFLGGRVPFPKGSSPAFYSRSRDDAGNRSYWGPFSPLRARRSFRCMPYHTPLGHVTVGGPTAWRSDNVVIGGAILAAWGIFALLLSVTEKDETDAFERESVRARVG